jgi:hypothetical protein
MQNTRPDPSFFSSDLAELFDNSMSVRQYKNKIFIIGFNRCGRRSLHYFFKDNRLVYIFMHRDNLIPSKSTTTLKNSGIERSASWYYALTKYRASRYLGRWPTNTAEAGVTVSCVPLYAYGFIRTLPLASNALAIRIVFHLVRVTPLSFK